MEEFFSNYGIGSETFRVIVLPLLIFLARIMDVSINTIRIIFVMNGRKAVSTILGFFESLIWLLAIGQIFQHVDNIYSYIAYPAGFAAGILVGMLIEERLAFGKVVVRIISGESLGELVDYLQQKNIRYAMVDAQSKAGDETLLFTVIKRAKLHEYLSQVEKNVPRAFYTVESVKRANETDDMLMEKVGRTGTGSWLKSVKRR